MLAGRHGSPGRWLSRAQGWVEREAAGILERVRFVPLEAKTTAALPRGDASLHELEWRSARVKSQAVMHVTDGECRLVALCVAGERRALCSISFEDEDDAGWALETWRSVDAAALA